MPLHMTRVAFGCGIVPDIADRQRQFAGELPDGRRFITTARGPARADELAGGSLYWIIRHRIVARQRLLGFQPHGASVAILLDPDVVPVLAAARRSHQGWRYLPPADAPPDLADAGEAAALPPEMAAMLGRLGLV